MDGRRFATRGPKRELMGESMSESTEANADGSAEDSSEAEAVNDTGVGALLRASRMRIGEDLRDVADMLRIRHPYL